ncbi:MAG TPA: chloride channel protein [Tepidisphaeraceae bacterium]|nr:chloride channel protein [Tepidisphaeraceae bacterium]
MLSAMLAAGARFHLLTNRVLVRLGFREDAFLLLVAVLIGLVTAAASVAFHELIVVTRQFFFARPGEQFLYGRGMWVLVLVPTLGGLVVGIISRKVFGVRGIHGMVDVIESVIRERGFIRPVAAVEKTLTAGLTIGTGGSVGAEAPIVQIGAAIASGFGRLFGIARHHMPMAVGCGSAAGISAIFNSPVGGVLFTLEVILGEYSLRTFAPMVVASFTANITTQAIMGYVAPGRPFQAIFGLPASVVGQPHNVGWATAPHFLVLGIAAGLVAVAFTKLMVRLERDFARLPLPPYAKPAVGGFCVGLLGVLYVLGVGHALLGRAKPIPFDTYPMPAFFSDGYGAIQPMLYAGFYEWYGTGHLVAFLAALLALKVLAASLTVSSGGGGGVIGPALFLGAVLGGLLGMFYRLVGSTVAQPHVMALVGMAAVLSAVVHAPMASVVILLELTQDYKLTLPAMIATVVSVGVARMIARDSIYMIVLRERGVNVGDSADLRLLRRLTVEQVELAPVTTVREGDAVAQLLGRIEDDGVGDYVVIDAAGAYAGMVTADDLVSAMHAGDAGTLLVVGDLAHAEIPPVRTSDDLASVLDRFALHDVEHLPVTTDRSPRRVIGLVSRANLLRRYRQGLGVGT